MPGFTVTATFTLRDAEDEREAEMYVRDILESDGFEAVSVIASQHRVQTPPINQPERSET